MCGAQGWGPRVGPRGVVYVGGLLTGYIVLAQTLGMADVFPFTNLKIVRRKIVSVALYTADLLPVYRRANETCLPLQSMRRVILLDSSQWHGLSVP